MPHDVDVSQNVTRAEFLRLNDVLLETADDLRDGDLDRWKAGRDRIAQRALERDRLEAERAGTPPRQHARARVAAQAHLAGYGRAFTEDVGFGGMSLRPNDGRVEIRRGEEASVRLLLAKRSELCFVL